MLACIPVAGRAARLPANSGSRTSARRRKRHPARCRTRSQIPARFRSSRRVPACFASTRKSASRRAPVAFREASSATTGPQSAADAAASARSGRPSAFASLSSRFWLGGQINDIAQGHLSFPALYSGPHSFDRHAEDAVTSIEDLYTGARITRDFSVLFDVEDIRGTGLSGVVGMGGFPNLDAQRAPTPGVGAVHTYMSRLLLHYVVPLGGHMVANTPSNFELASSLPSRRLEIYFGKFSLADFFDHNAYANDDHSQFLNWTADENGAWDFAANTAGYTYGTYLEFDDNAWTFRFAEALMTRNPNGRYLSLRIGTSRAENAQVGWAYSPSTNGKVRLLGFVDEAPMGSFANALAAWRKGLTPRPEVDAVRQVGAHEYGFGLNWQQGLPYGFGVFARLGWNNGKFDNYSFTEVNSTFEGGFQIPGSLWHRPGDHAGTVFISNGISRLHQEYLAAGGLGFILGDGGLTYGREDIFESYYNLKLPLGFSFGPDIQFVTNPGYNRARGPVTVFGMRMHIHFGFHRLPIH